MLVVETLNEEYELPSDERSQSKVTPAPEAVAPETDTVTLALALAQIGLAVVNTAVPPNGDASTVNVDAEDVTVPQPKEVVTRTLTAYVPAAKPEIEYEVGNDVPFPMVIQFVPLS